MKRNLNSVGGKYQLGSQPYQYKCQNCGTVIVMTTDVFMKQLEEVLAERDELRKRLEEREKK